MLVLQAVVAVEEPQDKRQRHTIDIQSILKTWAHRSHPTSNTRYRSSTRPSRRDRKTESERWFKQINYQERKEGRDHCKRNLVCLPDPLRSPASRTSYPLRGTAGSGCNWQPSSKIATCGRSPTPTRSTTSSTWTSQGHRSENQRTNLQDCIVEASSQSATSAEAQDAMW